MIEREQNTPYIKYEMQKQKVWTFRKNDRGVECEI
jgi:hypothetical protein